MLEGTIWHIFFRRVAPAEQEQLRATLPIREQGRISLPLLQTALDAVKALNPKLEILVNEAAPRNFDWSKLPPQIREKLQPPSEDAVNVTIYDPTGFPKRIRTEGASHQSMLRKQVLPEPQPVSGVVRLSVVIAKDGSVLELEPVDGPEALIEPALSAVRQWQYEPTLLNGLPVEIKTTVNVAFHS